MLCVALATGLVLFLGFQRVNGFVSPQVSQRRWPTFRAAASMIPAPLAAVGLKKELAARGLVVSGRKADLVARLSCADIEGSEVNDDDVDDDLESIVEDDGPDAPDTELPPWSQTNGLIDASKVPAGFRAGFVSIIGFPNAGKSTLMNHLVGDSLAVVTPSPQTTRHSIMGVATQKRHQLIYTDTPGMLDPKYMLHERMMKSVRSAMKHAEVLLAVVDACEVSPRGICSRHPPSFWRPHLSVYISLLLYQRTSGHRQPLPCSAAGSQPPASHTAPEDMLLRAARASHRPVVIALNKIDALTAAGRSVQAVADQWQSFAPAAHIVPVSALTVRRACMVSRAMWAARMTLSGALPCPVHRGRTVTH